MIPTHSSHKINNMKIIHQVHPE
ncbi:MAG: hypothetical protein RL544_1530, partial [Bacteroidota bacterium]